MLNTINIKKFKKEDFLEYLLWFDDAELNQRLGPMEDGDEWLTSVLNDIKGCTYSLFLDKELVSVIGIAFPDYENPTYCITNIAIKPSQRGQGIGKEVLRKTMALQHLEAGQYWIAYVEEDNAKAKRFFERNGWKVSPNIQDESDMVLYVLRNTNRKL